MHTFIIFYKTLNIQNILVAGPCKEGGNDDYVYDSPYNYKREKMLETIAIILIILWALGLVSSYTMGGFIHILLVIAIVAVLIRIIKGRRIL